jgi:tyrosinase
MPTYAITGIQDGLDDDTNPLRQVPLRLEIDDWCTRTDDVYKNQRALFFLAFNNFCRMDPKEKLSYFQIAGVSMTKSMPS